tara:strand:- start:264 stop:500 length:237 start_codon:yes stop_codon:yes gene_type:complete
MLDECKFKYITIDIQSDSAALHFMKERGHTTVPQLYYDGIHINKKNTYDYTKEQLTALILEAQDAQWPWRDSGIEQEI